MTEQADNPTGDAGASTGAADTSGAATASTDTSATAAVGGSDPGGAASAQAPVRPEGLPDEFWDDAAGVKVGDLASKYREMAAKVAEIEAAKGAIPEKAEGYVLAVPEGITPPDGFSLKIDESHPFAKEFREFAFAKKMTQADLNLVLEVEAQRQISAQKAMVEREVSNRTALGENIDKRLTDLNGRAGANLPAELAKAVALTRYSDPNAVKAMEAIWAMKAGPSVLQGGGNTAGKYEGLQGEALLTAIRADGAKTKAA